MVSDVLYPLLFQPTEEHSHLRFEGVGLVLRLKCFGCCFARWKNNRKFVIPPRANGILFVLNAEAQKGLRQEILLVGIGRATTEKNKLVREPLFAVPIIVLPRHITYFFRFLTGEDLKESMNNLVLLPSIILGQVR
jgi:hypothetical protein